ncbi:MAG: YeeE/YedE family protein [Bacteriovoracaceae bacterium]|nr:YeeE/YedE family protein [Bacteriovoracaceae bacterium]
MNELSGGQWSPYVAGISIGLLTLLTFKFSDKPVGASSAYATLAGLLGKLVAPIHTMKLKYFKENTPKPNWELVFVSSAIIGSFISAWTGGEFEVRVVPELWEQKFGTGSVSSYGLSGFVGGVLMAFGARLAGGCTSGHGISGTSQLSVASWVTLISLFLSGVFFVQLIY